MLPQKNSKPSPRQRRRRQRWLNHGEPKRLPTLFTNPAEYNADMILVVTVLAQNGYRVPADTFNTIRNSTLKIVKDHEAPTTLQLRAIDLIRLMIKNADRAQLIEAEIDTAKRNQRAGVANQGGQQTDDTTTKSEAGRAAAVPPKREHDAGSRTRAIVTATKCRNRSRRIGAI